jgi:enoyl-CoA hydratase
MSSPETVSYAVQDRVAVVTIRRPEVRNAVDGPTAASLAAAFRRFDADREADIAILTGAGGAFCAGADLKAVAEGRGNITRDHGDGPMGCSRLKLTKPVIAAIEGHAVAGGLELALWCDLRVAAQDAVLGVFCRRWGVPLIDLGTVRLPRLIGQSRAMDLILTGRPVGAEEAERIGLVNRLAEPGQALTVALELARSLAKLPQRCLRSDRLSVLEQWDMGHEAAMLNEFRLGMATIASGETREGASRFAAGAGRHGEAAADQG